MAARKKSSEPLIQVRDLLIEFGLGRKKVKAVKGVTFDVIKGETFGLVGESGSGKTTVAKAIMGMQPIADGAVYFEGKLSRGKEPNLYRLSKALEHNLDILIENQGSTTLKMNDYILEYKRIYYKYLDSKFFDFKTGELRPYKDGVDRRIPEGVNLKNTKIITSDKENHLKQLSILVNDSLKRLVKILRILQKTTQFTNDLSNYIDIDPKLDKTLTKYLNTLKQKILKVKEYENKVYFALQNIKKIRKQVLNGEYTSAVKFFNDLGNEIKVMVANHKEISIVVKSINKDITFVQALVSPKSERSKYLRKLLKTLEALQATVGVDDPKTIKEYQTVIDLMRLKNINTAIEESTIFAKTTKKAKKNLKQEMQMIFQDPASSLNDMMSIEEIIGEGLNNFPELYKNDVVVDEYVDWYNTNHSNEEQISRRNVKNSQVKHYLVLKQLESVGLLPEHLSRYPHEFSGGQRQRIGIARALIMNPKFIVADEPISALDVSIRAQVLNLLSKFQKEQDLTYIFIAHDLSVVRHIANRIAVIYHGDIVELAGAEELFNNPLHPYTKSLLTAIPLADPDQEAKKVHLEYDPAKEHPDYLSDFPVWQEVSRGHFVYANQREMEHYQTEMAAKAKKQTKKKTSSKPKSKKKGD